MKKDHITLEDNYTLPSFSSEPSNKIQCYFSEINDLAELMNYSNVEKQKIPTKPIHFLYAKAPNCYVQIQQQGLLIISKGGNNFHIPLQQKIQTVFPLAEGLLIQYVVKQDPKFAEILYYQKNKNILNSSEEQSKYSYVTLNKHPLNPLKVLGCLKKEEILPWLNLNEKIIYVNPHLPLIISYNTLLQRNAFHLLKINVEESQKEFQKVNFHHNFYTIKDMVESQSTISELISELFFEENTRQFAAQKILITKGKFFGEIFIHLLIVNDEGNQYLKIFSVKLLDNCQVKLISVIPDVIDLTGFYLFDQTVKKPKIQNVHKKNNKNRELQIQLLLKSVKKLYDFVIVVDNLNYYILSNATAIFRSPINFPRKQQEIKSVTFLSEFEFKIETTNKTIFNKQIIQKISDNLTCILFYVLSEIVDQKIYEKILMDYLIQRSNNKGLSEFQIFQNYIVSILKETSKNKVEVSKNLTLLQFTSVKNKIAKILHLLYQEIKLYQIVTYRLDLINFLYVFSFYNKTETKYLFCDYYMRQGADIQNLQEIIEFKTIQKEKSETEIADIFKFLTQLIQNKKSQIELGIVNDSHKMPIAFKRTKFVCRLFELLIDGEVGRRSYISQILTTKLKGQIYGLNIKQIYNQTYPLYHQKVFFMNYYRKKIEGFLNLQKIKQSINNKEQKVFLFLIQKGMTLEKIKTFPSGISTPIFQILRIMRRYLPNTLYQIIPKLGFRLINREDLHKNIKLYKKQPIRLPYHLQNQSLNSTIQTLIHSSTSEEYYLTSNTFQMNKFNNDLIFEEVSRLLNSTSQIKIKAKQIESIPEDKWEVQSQNILAKFSNRRLSVLTGQGAFTMGTSQTYITQVIKINKINLSAIMPNDIKITLDLKDDKQAVIFWPEFHSGVAAGLKLSRHIIPLSQDHLKTWIFYQKPENPKRDHSGFLLSLGLLGYLQCFSPTDIYQYLKPNNQFTSVAILLGVSASNISRCEQSLSKTLILHIPCLLPPSVDIQIPINVQTSALIGIGLLNKGTSNRTMTQMTLSQIGKKPNSDKCLDRQGYSLAAGWALGVICLGMNGKRQSLRDLQLQQRLIRFIQGGKVMEPPQSMISSNFNNENKCSSIKEGNTVNLHITAPSALIAISLMYLKSNNYQLSKRITIPNSFNTIQQCNPNLILLKVIAKNLIMWNSIDNSPEFLMNQIPQLIRFIFENSLHNVRQRYYLVYNVSQIDYHTITTIYASVMTGGVVAMGMKYAGTGDKKAVETIKNHIQKLRAMKILKCELANDPMNKNAIDQYQLFTLLSVSLLSLSLIMAGTCDIECLKTARIIRKRIQDHNNFHYGFNMAINMAIGFICLGYGNYSFNRSDLSIAALLIAIYPHFPNSPSDNKWHLQALRHFYVLAVEQKVFHAVDVDTNKVVNVNIQMKFSINNQQKKQQLHTPILLQESKKLLGLKVRDEDYFDIDFNFDNYNTQPKVIYIKKKFSKDIDVHHFKSLNPEDYEHLPVTAETAKDIKKAFNKQIKYKSIKGLKSREIDEKILNSILPKSSKKQKIIDLVNQYDKKNKFWTSLTFNQIYYEFMKEDRLDLLEIYLDILRKREDMLKWKPQILDNLKLMHKFYETPELITFMMNNESIFFNPTKFELLFKNFENLALREYQNFRKSEHYKVYFSRPDQIYNKIPQSVLKVLNFFNIPNKYELKLIKGFFEKLCTMSGDTKNKTSKENFSKNLSSVCQMYLYMSFPLCPIPILNDIGLFFLCPE